LIGVLAGPATASPSTAAATTWSFAEAQLLATGSGRAAGTYPSYTTSSGAWTTVPASDWTSGFFSGCLWLTYEETGDPAWRTRAEQAMAEIESRDTDTSFSDTGFQFLTTYANAYRLTGDEHARQVVLTAASSLASRFNSAVGAFPSAWPTNGLNVTIDEMMDIGLLFKAADYGGDPHFRDLAVSHALRTAQDHLRDDGSVYEAVTYDPTTGGALTKWNPKGYSNSSVWSRGQAWAVAGFTTAYAETGDTRLLDAAQRAASFYTGHMPADGVPYWDFDAPGQPSAPRDSSAAAAAASGLLHLSTLVGEPSRSQYESAAHTIVKSLSSSAYLAQGTTFASILRRGAFSYQRNIMNRGLIFGDYYFLEALRFTEQLAPGAPTAVSATVGDSQATVAFSPPANQGNSAVSSYTAVASPGGAKVTGTASPLTVRGLVDGTAYTFTVYATNAVGDGPPSAPSNIVVPQPKADVRLALTASSAAPVSGSMLSYTIRITNAGPKTASGLVATDTIPQGETFAAVTTSIGTCSQPPPGGGGTVSCSISSLAYGASATITLKVTVVAARGASVTDTASVSSTSYDPNLTNNSKSVTVTVA